MGGPLATNIAPSIDAFANPEKSWHRSWEETFVEVLGAPFVYEQSQ